MKTNIQVTVSSLKDSKHKTVLKNCSAESNLSHLMKFNQCRQLI